VNQKKKAARVPEAFSTTLIRAELVKFRRYT